METQGVPSTDPVFDPAESDASQRWIGALGGAAVVIGALLHWAGPVAGTQTNLRALWDPALVRDTNLIRTIGFAMIVLGVVAVVGAIWRAPQVTGLAGALVIGGIALFAISIMRGSGNIMDINTGPVVCFIGGLAAISAELLARRVTKTT